MWVQPVGEEDPPEKEKTTHSSILAWKIPWKEEPGRLQCLGSQRVGHDLGTERIYMQRKRQKKYLKKYAQKFPKFDKRHEPTIQEVQQISRYTRTHRDPH